MTDYTLIRSRRRTASLQIKNGAVCVRAPMKMPKREIDAFVAENDKWIRERVAQSLACARQRDAFEVNYGDCISYRGKTYPIEAADGRYAGFDGSRFFVPAGFSSEHVKCTLVRVYRMLAKKYLVERVRYFAGQMNVSPYAVKINGAKTHWASCSAKKSLNFSWMLIMADDDAIDYIVVHELAHLIELNHSAKFWAVVENMMPGYGECEKRLKELQKRLLTEDWE